MIGIENSSKGRSSIGYKTAHMDPSIGLSHSRPSEQKVGGRHRQVLPIQRIRQGRLAEHSLVQRGVGSARRRFRSTSLLCLMLCFLFSMVSAPFQFPRQMEGLRRLLACRALRPFGAEGSLGWSCGGTPQLTSRGLSSTQSHSTNWK